MKLGKLKFKEGAPKPTYIPKKARKNDDKQQEGEEDIIAQDQIINYQPKPGSGSITTSGRTIHGNQSLFRTQVQKGDSIIIQNPTFKTTQERAITLVLSDKSILLEEPFLEEYATYVPYMIKKKTKVIQGENLTQKYKERMEEQTKTKGIKKTEMDVRLKKSMWSYQTKKVQVTANLSRQELLNLRQKMIKDKHCW